MPIASDTTSTSAPLQSAAPATAANGAIAHPDHIAHRERLTRKLYPVGDHAWCYVGNGLSNQTFVAGPAGLIAIDTGESVEEMRDALAALREVTDLPVVACIYSHFHYVNGTTALLDASPGLEIWGHAGIPDNLARFGGEVAPRSGRGLVHQFGVMLPDTGPDALSHCGLGLFYRNPAHAPYTPGYVPAQRTFREETHAQIAGLDVTLTPAPSDATDSITIWFPSLGLAVNNLLWPALFNIYAIRGEEYRDPRILLRGLDHISALKPSFLAGTHGPPLIGAEIAPAILDYRDAIQFIWDQTVRHANRGLTLSEIAHAVRLPERFNRTYLTRQFYGVVEHHVRQIHAGLFGWFDEHEAHLFPLTTPERHRRLIDGFGGRDTVRTQFDAALAADDFRWALELGAWLTYSPDAESADRQRLADALRATARHTLSANVRNWCLTRALELEGNISLEHLRTHRLRTHQVLAVPPADSVRQLRVLLDPDKAGDIDGHIAWHFADRTRCGLHVRGGVAVPTDGNAADWQLSLSLETWATVLGGKLRFQDAVDEGTISIGGDESALRTLLQAFDVSGLH